jgi:hypothetical protein
MATKTRGASPIFLDEDMEEESSKGVLSDVVSN